jgi:hypothetical protein
VPAATGSLVMPLLLTALPIVLLWIYMPGSLDNLLHLAGAALGR